jgi:hypothetical protein
MCYHIRSPTFVLFENLGNGLRPGRKMSREFASPIVGAGLPENTSRRVGVVAHAGRKLDVRAQDARSHALSALTLSRLMP